MHDRRIDGVAHTFGNYGALYINAMTWYDHETESVWSQPLGTAIQGSYKGVRLEMIPAEVVPWATWKKGHPDTWVLDTGITKTLPPVDPFDKSKGNFFISIAIGDRAKVYWFDLVSRQVVVNDHIGELPVVVYANPEDKAVHVYVRRLHEQVLDFQWVNGRLQDQQTGTLWDPAKGLGVEGPLRGRLLKKLPYASSYGWPWLSFYPGTEMYTPPKSDQ